MKHPSIARIMFISPRTEALTLHSLSSADVKKWAIKGARLDDATHSI